MRRPLLWSGDFAGKMIVATNSNIVFPWVKPLVIAYILLYALPSITFGQVDDSSRSTVIGLKVQPYTSWNKTSVVSSPFGNRYGASTGAFLQHMFSRKLGFRTSINHTYYNGHIICDSIKIIDFARIICYGTEHEKIHYVGMTIGFIGRIHDSEKTKIDAFLGVNYGYLLEKQSNISGDIRNYRANDWNIVSSVGIELPISKNLVFKGQIQLSSFGIKIVNFGPTLSVGYII